jgi:hypothetical protein
VLLNMPTVVISHSLLVLPYPIMPIAHSFHPLYNPSRSFQRPLGPRRLSACGGGGPVSPVVDIRNAIGVLAVGQAIDSNEAYCWKISQREDTEK